jgi:membrane dipeptidase
MYLIDAHQDLAYNVLNFGRNYFRSAAETRQFESETRSSVPKNNGNTLLGYPDFQKARTAVIFATLYASPERHRMGSWNKVFYRDYEQAHKLYQAQADVYHRWADDEPDKIRLIRTKNEMAEIMAPWLEKSHEAETSSNPVGLVILMEGAEGVRQVEELELWWERGVRIIGPAWAGTRYCGGTKEPGPLTKDGFGLLEVMADFGFTLDLSHMDEQAARQSLDVYPGPLIASHANAAALMKRSESNRHLSNRVIPAQLSHSWTSLPTSIISVRSPGTLHM